MKTFLPSPVTRAFGLALVAGALLVTRASGAYPVVPAFGGVSFEEPVQIVFAPGETNRAFVAERPGWIAVLRNLGNRTREVALDLSARVNQGTPDHGLLSIALHPNFAQNGFVYVWTSLWENGARSLRLLRFTLNAAGTFDLASELTLINQPINPGGHDGGTLLFGADGYLYLSIGDGDPMGGASAETVASHQRIDRGFFGGVLRIDVDKRPGSLAPNPYAGLTLANYAIPPDNPFVGATSFSGQPVNPATLRTEFWAAGLRNPFRMAFDPANGDLWLGDVGLDLIEEIDVVAKGQNHGWDFFEGDQPGPRASSRPAGVTFTPPLWQYDHSQGDFSVTGGLVYRGTRYPELRDRYLFADFISGRIWSISSLATRPIQSGQVSQIGSETGVVQITEQPGTGDLLLVNYFRGTIERLGDPSSAAVPPTIAAQPSAQTIATGGTVAFNVIASGTPAPTYQWTYNGTPISGATSATYVLKNAAAADAGSYAVTLTNSSGSMVSVPVKLTVVAATPGERRVINISTRGFVGTADNILIAGFVIGGTTAKTVLIRASGPALGAFGVPGTLPDPELKLLGPSGPPVTNAGWGGSAAIASAAKSVGAFEWTNSSSKDAALLVTLPPGTYTAQVAGASGDTGVALVEVYDVP